MSSPERSVLEAVAAHGLDPGDLPGDRANDPVYLVDAERTVARYAARLAAVHDVPAPAGAPSERTSTGRLVEAAREAVRSGRVGAHTLSPPYQHLRTERLLEVLESGADEFATGPSTLTHGRPELARLRCQDGDVLGFVEWDHAAWADPHRDLAVAARQVADVLVPVLVPALFEHYRAARGDWSGPEPLRLDWYALAFELGC